MKSSTNLYKYSFTIGLSLLLGLIVKVLWVYIYDSPQIPSIRLFALWLPLMYIAFSFYYFFLELRTGLTESLKVAHQRDGYTHLGWMVIFLLMICYQDIGPWQLWFGIAYLSIFITKMIIAGLIILESKSQPLNHKT